MPSKVLSLERAAALVQDGSSLGVGGVLLKRKPMRFLSELAATRSGLELCSFLASLDAELLTVSGALAGAHTGYVGFEHLGFAPGYQAAVAAGQVAAREYTEFLFVAGLRASQAGLPFLPAKGGMGSQILEELGFEEIASPYTGEPVIAVPPMRPEVTVIHAEAADPRGNVLAPSSPDFLYDFDRLIARASERVVVTVEEIVDTAAVAGDPRPILLFGYEVDAVVLAPGGARPTAMPGHYPADLAAIRAYLGAVGSGGNAAAAIKDLL